MANEAFTRIRIDQLLKDVDRSLTDGRSVRFEYPFNDGVKTGHALFGCQVRALAMLKTKRMGVNPGAGGTRKVCCGNA